MTFFIYYQGLKGNYVFDDPANILDNKALAINTLNFENLRAAFYSGDAGPLGRPISMLSFALNHYFTGFDPFYFKITNLVIHLINGILIYIFSLQIFNWLAISRTNIKKNTTLMALAIASIWLVHPINLTSILYVVQRMTSLSTLFGFLAIVFYCSWRIKNSTISFSVISWLGIVLSLTASIFSKESGLLFIGLIYWIELLIFQGKNLQQQDIKLGKFKLIQYLWVGVILGFILLIYIAVPYISTSISGNRDFNTIERLLTESRVIFYYLKLIFFPLLSDLSLYHDDFIISSSFTHPITTLWSILGLIIISLISLIIAKRFPLILFAWGWYVISQLMESTFISLELVHEHRNYFGTIGFILAAVFYTTQISSQKIKLTIYFFGLVYFCNLSFTTWQRANLWSNLVDQGLYEATMHPQSDRANYQMARVFMQLMQNEPDKKTYYAEQAWKYLELAKRSYKPGNGAWFAELHLASYLNQPISNRVVDELVYNLQHHPFYNSNLSFLSAFANCQIEGDCHVEHNQAVRIISASLENSKTSPDIQAELYKLLAQYFVSVAHDFQKGEEFMQDAIKLKQDTNGYLIFAQIYRLQHKFTEAQQQLNLAIKSDTKGIWHQEILIEQRNIRNAESTQKGT
ncbi:hypothetical protein F4V57_08790 [Acinetobacter qingfengensis]|uniref:Tetratricopeptide repeat protein n=1 Tax=Acinetobacter qingfengensis TaxID=1262585 RepID=A0A1E7R170_9GAMM|nr:hypothetical protein [Acinetobacter qingfengensis]KAA8733311.1 hypothetical protein F4V57_08790 [Acinetobacter qingfengensis]OEY93058.1 hypothetical protein BJI46_04770 [Acinetobacter qingfengensis]